MKIMASAPTTTRGRTSVARAGADFRASGPKKTLFGAGAHGRAQKPWDIHLKRPPILPTLGYKALTIEGIARVY